MTPTFKLPIGKFVKITTVLVIVLMLALPIGLMLFVPKDIHWVFWLVILMDLLILAGTYAFAPQRVSIDKQTLIVHYPAHQRTYNIAKAEVHALDRKDIWPSTRTFGNGGLFAISGNFRKKTLGSFRYHSRHYGPSTLFTLANDRQVVIGLEYTGAWAQAVSSATR